MFMYVYQRLMYGCFIQTSQDANDLDGRTSWLDTRNLEENFKELVYLSIQEVTIPLATRFFLMMLDSQLVIALDPQP